MTAQAMVDMQRRQGDAGLARQSASRVKQYCGIEAAGIAHHDGLPRPDITGKTGRNALDYKLSG